MQESDPAVRVVSLEAWQFRNLGTGERPLLFQPSAGFNLIVGENGHGKTNLLESLYITATTKSFRATRLSETITQGRDAATLRLRVQADGLVREQRASFSATGRSFLVDEKRAENSASYASRTPLVLFHPGELELSLGSGATRRKLLDRLLLYVEPASMDSLLAYGKALRARQRLLEERPTGSELEIYESLLVRHGIELSRARKRILDRLRPAASEAFHSFGSPGRALEITYATNVPDDETIYARKLVEDRPKDARRNSASTGPHRDDIALHLDDTLARGFASQGQHRAIVMALKMAEITVLEQHRGRAPIFLLDDLSSEFDAERLRALLRVLRERKAQMFVTSTRKELFTEALESPGATAVHMASGRLEATP